MLLSKRPSISSHITRFTTTGFTTCFHSTSNRVAKHTSRSGRSNMMLRIQIPSFNINPRHYFTTHLSSSYSLSSSKGCKERCQQFHGLAPRKRVSHKSFNILPLQSLPNAWEEPDACGSDEEESTDDNDEESSPQLISHRFNEGSGDQQVDKDTEQFMKDVELLLEPKERHILLKNEAPDFSKLSSPKWIPFHTLATSGQIFLMDDALKHGIDVNVVDKDGLTALHKAVLCKKEAVVSRLLRRGADPHVRDKDGATLLHYAVAVSAIQSIKLLIKLGVDVNLVDNEGWTALHLAVQSRTRDVAKILLINGADKTIRNKDGNTPIDLAICFGKGFKSYDLTKLLKLVPPMTVV